LKVLRISPTSFGGALIFFETSFPAATSFPHDDSCLMGLTNHRVTNIEMKKTIIIVRINEILVISLNLLA